MIRLATGLAVAALLLVNAQPSHAKGKPAKAKAKPKASAVADDEMDPYGETATRDTDAVSDAPDAAVLKGMVGGDPFGGSPRGGGKSLDFEDDDADAALDTGLEELTRQRIDLGSELQAAGGMRGTAKPSRAPVRVNVKDDIESRRAESADKRKRAETLAAEKKQKLREASAAQAAAPAPAERRGMKLAPVAGRSLEPRAPEAGIADDGDAMALAGFDKNARKGDKGTGGGGGKAKAKAARGDDAALEDALWAGSPMTGADASAGAGASDPGDDVVLAEAEEAPSLFETIKAAVGLGMPAPKAKVVAGKQRSGTGTGTGTTSSPSAPARSTDAPAPAPAEVDDKAVLGLFAANDGPASAPAPAPAPAPASRDTRATSSAGTTTSTAPARAALAGVAPTDVSVRSGVIDDDAAPATPTTPEKSPGIFERLFGSLDDDDDDLEADALAAADIPTGTAVADLGVAPTLGNKQGAPAPAQAAGAPKSVAAASASASASDAAVADADAQVAPAHTATSTATAAPAIAAATKRTATAAPAQTAKRKSPGFLSRLIARVRGKATPTTALAAKPVLTAATTTADASDASDHAEDHASEELGVAPEAQGLAAASAAGKSIQADAAHAVTPGRLPGPNALVVIGGVFLLLAVGTFGINTMLRRRR